MESVMAGENLFLLYSILMGIFITFIYDLLRIFRRVVKHNILAVSAEDIAFWIFCAASVFYMMYEQSNGTLRWFAVLGALCGMGVYLKTLSQFLVKWVSKGLKYVTGMAGKGLYVASTPLRFAGRESIRAAQRTAAGGKRFRGYLKKKLTAFAKMIKMILCKQ